MTIIYTNLRTGKSCDYFYGTGPRDQDIIQEDYTETATGKVFKTEFHRGIESRRVKDDIAIGGCLRTKEITDIFKVIEFLAENYIQRE